MLSPKSLGLIAVLPLDQIDQMLVGVVRPSSPGQIAGVRALDELHARGGLVQDKTKHPIHQRQGLVASEVNE